MTLFDVGPIHEAEDDRAEFARACRWAAALEAHVSCRKCSGPWTLGDRAVRGLVDSFTGRWNEQWIQPQMCGRCAAEQTGGLQASMWELGWEVVHAMSQENRWVGWDDNGDAARQALRNRAIPLAPNLPRPVHPHSMLPVESAIWVEHADGDERFWRPAKFVVARDGIVWTKGDEPAWV